MPMSLTLGNYVDVRAILDAAIKAGGAEYVLDTPGRAIHWRQRAYYFRSLLRKESLKAALIPGYLPSTPYDGWEFVIEKKKDPTVVIIRRISATGGLRNFAGEALPLEPEPERNELDHVVDELVRRKGV